MVSRDATSALAMSSRWIEALERQAATIMGIFITRGFEPISPPVIQPADLFLDLIGEELRARTYIFNDPNGAELCFRPDLTVPACQLYLDRHPDADVAARYAYTGLVFRYQPGGGTILRPREFHQVGLECLAASDPARAEIEVLAHAVVAVRAAGLTAFRVRIGDLGIISAILDRIAMPDRWRRRLAHHFWRPAAFHRQLRELVEGHDRAARLPPGLAEALERAPDGERVEVVARHVDALGLQAAGTRTLDEIAEQLMGSIADAREPPLPAAAAELLQSYLAVRAPAREAHDLIHKLTSAAGIRIDDALAAYERRIVLAGEQEIDLSQSTFSASFGRAFEYYTGFVFELQSTALDEATPLGGGGRYDTLVGAVASATGRSVATVPAVGAALHMPRLLYAIRGGRP